MSRCLVLYLDRHHASLHMWQRSRLSPEGSFTANEEGLAALTARLAEVKNTPLRILANLPDEDYHLETIPYLGKRDRQALLDRKIGQLFSDVALTATISIGYEKTERKNEKILFAALPHATDLSPWLACIASAGIPLAGIHTLSQLAGPLLRKTGLAPEIYLLLSFHGDSLRESLVMCRETAFSRLVPWTASDIPAGISTELARLHQYLVGRGMIGHGEILPVIVIAHPRAEPELRHHLAPSPGLSYRLLDSHALARQIGLHTPPADDDSELLFLHTLATAPPRRQFADKLLLQRYHQFQGRRRLLGATALMLSVALPVAGLGFQESRSYRKDIDAQKILEADLNQRRDRTLADFSRMDTDAPTLRRLTDRFAELQLLQRQPADGFRMLSRAMEQVPEIELESLDWSVARNGPPAAAVEETMVLRASIVKSTGPIGRPTITGLSDFIRVLEKNPGVRTAIREQPTDILSGQLVGGVEQGRGTPYSFVLAITRQLEP